MWKMAKGSGLNGSRHSPYLLISWCLLFWFVSVVPKHLNFETDFKQFITCLLCSNIFQTEECKQHDSKWIQGPSMHKCIVSQFSPLHSPSHILFICDFWIWMSSVYRMFKGCDAMWPGRHIPPECWYLFSKIKSFTFQRTINLTLTAMRTPNLRNIISLTSFLSQRHVWSQTPKFN